jgi:sulfatase modifying factor 1
MKLLPTIPVLGLLAGCVSTQMQLGSRPTRVAGGSSGSQVLSLETRTNSIGIKLVKLPGGTFEMGDPRPALGATPVHTVTLRSFWMGQYEVTNSQLEHFLKLPLPTVSPGSRHPAVNMSWLEADGFCRWLSRREGRVYRLPTEAEWEYAARGGLVGKDYPWGNEPPDGRAQVAALTAAPVGSFAPNGFGLFDMAGNVVEYVSDWDDEAYYSRSPEQNPTGPSRPPTHRSKVTRDGPFGAWEPYCAGRLSTGRYWRSETNGFRVAMDLEGVPRLPDLVDQPPQPDRTIDDPEIVVAAARSVDEAMVVAISRSNNGAARILLQQGARVDLRGYENATLLHVAVASNDPGFVKAVLERGTPIEARTTTGETCLIRAANMCDPDLVQLLLKRGAAVNAADKQGVTALMWAARNGTAATVKVLLRHGADPSLKDTDGHAASWYAQDIGNPETARLLPVLSAD